MIKGKAFVALSGGVDSAVSAYLLKQEGYEVTGVYMKGWTAPDVECRESEDRQDAARVAATLGIAFQTLDTSKEYERLVLEPFLRDYENGLTPNPDVLCNSQIKFGVFADYARKNGADVLATGHYARIVDGKIRSAKDAQKDQTYFLWQTPQDVLLMLRFPIGELEKSEVRRIALEAGLPVAEKPDSQGVCFIGELDMVEFLRRRIPSKKGNIIDEHGNIIGEHGGVAFFTRGQRHGIKLSAPLPYYVAERNIQENTITVVEGREHPALFSRSVGVVNMHWLLSTPPGSNIYAQIRYRGERHPVRLVSCENDVLKFEAIGDPFWAPERGQSCVLYEKQVNDYMLLGGGVINQYI